ncbi:MAG: sulfotransferase domain-containing protein [Candidatus Cloacimonetes bacterium]|nr:sulfotransferase domain-containing protein [Candidatus Cloacimonadota bacterium]
MKINRVFKKARFRVFLVLKAILQPIVYSKNGLKQIVYVIACQRSGTSIMVKVFQRDFQTKIYEDEHSAITSEDKKSYIRFNTFESLIKIFSRVHAKVIITKPLVELQNILSYFDYFPGSKAIWIYRHYKDVAYSNITHFGKDNGHKNLRPILYADKNNWRSENLPDNIRKVVLEHYYDQMSSYDAAALFWYARNALFFELGLDKRDDVTMCKYEGFVNKPIENIRRLYSFLRIKYPGDKIVDEVHARATGKGTKLALLPEIDKLCKDLYEKMEKEYLANLS